MLSESFPILLSILARLPMLEISNTPDTTLPLKLQHLTSRVIAPPDGAGIEAEPVRSYDQNRQLGDLKLQLQFSSQAAAVCGEMRFR